MNHCSSDTYRTNLPQYGAGIEKIFVPKQLKLIIAYIRNIILVPRIQVKQNLARLGCSPDG